MQTSPNFYVSLIYLLAAVPFAWLGLFAWRKRPTAAVTPFAWAMLVLSIWSFAYSLELLLPFLPAKIFLAKVEYMGIISIPVFLLFFSFEYAGKSHLLTPRTRFLIWVIPLLSVLLAWTNDFHRQVWKMETISEANGLSLLTVHYGLFFLLQTIYSYILAIFASTLLVMEMTQRPKIYRIQISTIILAILTPLAGSLIYNSSLNPIPGLNITPLLFLPAALGLSWAIVRYRLLELLPLEHLTVLKNMKDGIIVVNLDNRILYINPLIENLIGRLEADVIGQPINHISKEYGEALASYLKNPEQQSELVVEQGSQAVVFEATVSPVSSLNVSKNLPGFDSMITLHDITERKKIETALSRRESMMSAISLAAQQLLKEAVWEHNIPGTLEKIGLAANVSRIYVFMNYLGEKDIIYTSQC